MLNYTVFIVDDEETIQVGVTSGLEDDYTIYAFGDAESALEEASKNKPDLVLLDIGLPGINGIEALGRFKEISEDILVIMITAFEDIQSVIDCMKTGAYDYIIKPIYMEGLEVTITNAFETIRLKKEIEELQKRQIGENVPCFIGETDAIHDLMEYIGLVARSPDTPILVLGDTGTGKELIASTIHYKSPNFSGPFVPVNCAAIPKDLFESELFGYEKGAFSGASPNGKKGLIEMAEAGTLFLDEIGELNLDAQAKLLRFMENGEFIKVGSSTNKQVATRIVSATNRNLEEMIHEGTFRKDLYFRISVIKINLPSLNERMGDIPLIANFFLGVFNKKFNRSLTGISPEAIRLLKRFSWSGNVRELKNMMERAALVSKGPVLSVADLGLDGVSKGEMREESVAARFGSIPQAGININDLRTTLDKHFFIQAMEISGGNESRAAKMLGLKQHTFRYQYKKIFGE